MDWEMLLKMTAATLAYVVITGFLWNYSRKKESRGRGWEIVVGLVYGACSVVANHFGIHYFGMLNLNVRDIGPLAAGLFFSPLSGVIAGTIGGAERIMAGEIWEIGKFTEIACGLSTFLAGILAAFLNRKVYQGKRPAMPQAFFLGAVTEVFHMYAVLFTNRGSMAQAYYVVETAAVPMIAFTAVGLALCSMTVMKLSKEPSDIGWKMQEERIPITVLFQRALLVVTVGLFVFNFIVSYNLQTRLALESIELRLQYLAYEKADVYRQNDNDLEALIQHIREQTSTGSYFMLVNGKTGEVEAQAEDSHIGPFTEKDMELFREKMNGETFRAPLDSLDGIEMFCCVATVNQDYFMVVLETPYNMESSRKDQMYESTLSDILLFTVLYMLVAMLADRLVVRNLHRVNTSLRKITNGNLDETVWVHTSAEFTDLSEDINKTVTALRGYIDAAEQRMKEELKLASAIQESALPKNFSLPAKNIELHALMTPAKQVGGDFYDFFYIGMDRLCLVIADVSGKGVPAAMFMMRAKTAIKNNARAGSSPAELLTLVNNTLCEGNDAEMFVTVWIGILELETGKMQCANAGHEYPVLMRSGGDYELLKDKHGLVLAAMEDVPMRGYEITLNPGDRLFVYTDGVPEAINEKDEAYGTDRLVSRLNRLKTASQERTLEDVLQDIRNFAGNAEQFDDITMLGLTYLSNDPS